MIKVLSAIVMLAAQTASAEQRVNKPFTTSNGRTVVTSPAAAKAAPKVFRMTTPGGGSGSNSAAAPAAHAAVAGTGGSRTVFGGGQKAAARNATGRNVQRGGQIGIGKNIDPPAPTEELPPHYTKPGALIRTTGHRLPEYEKTEQTTHRVDAGEIVLNPKKAVNVGQAPSLAYADKADKLPPPNPVNGKSYNTGAAANSPTGGNGNNNGNNNGPGNIGGGKADDKPLDVDAF